MGEKRKISIRKILQVLLTVVVTTCCVIAMVSASKIEGDKNLKTVVVHIKNDKKYHFIEQKEIMDLAINNRHVDIMNTPLSKLDVHAIEQVIKSDPWVAEAQAFIDIDRVLHMYVTQRVPVARIFEKDGRSYYMDATLHTMPLSDNYIYYTVLVTNVPALGKDAASTGLKKEICSLVKEIQADTFWNAQISQVNIDSAGRFELMPVLGNQRIVFGDTSDAKEKLDNLFAFYKHVLNRIGWDKYETLDLRFKGQVIASPSLPYKGPVDKAVANMNWINSIVITEAQNETKDSIKVTDLKDSPEHNAGAVDKPGDTKTAQEDNKQIAVHNTDAKNKPEDVKAAQKNNKSNTVRNAAVVAGGVGAALLVAKQLKKSNAAGKQSAAPAKKGAGIPMGKTVLLSRKKQKTDDKAGLKPHSTATGKGKLTAKQIAKIKAADKKKHDAARAKDKKGVKATAKNLKGKPVLKKNLKPAKNEKKVNKDKKASKDKNTKKGKPKYAYPEKKGNQ